MVFVVAGLQPIARSFEWTKPETFMNRYPCRHMSAIGYGIACGGRVHRFGLVYANGIRECDGHTAKVASADWEIGSGCDARCHLSRPFFRVVYPGRISLNNIRKVIQLIEIYI